MNLDEHQSSLTVAKLYANLHLHSVLQQHMWRVASLMELLLGNWTGPQVDKTLLIETMLLHDLGNLIKFDLRPDAPHKLMRPDEILFYRQLQGDWKAKYGHDVDEVTCLLVAEQPIKNRQPIITLISKHSVGTLADTVTHNDWLQKLCDYTDFRVGPHGLLTLAERFDDLAKRYQYRDPDWQDPQLVAARLQLFQTLETQLQAHISLDLNTLINQDLQPIERWQSYVFC